MNVLIKYVSHGNIGTHLRMTWGNAASNKKMKLVGGTNAY